MLSVGQILRQERIKKGYPLSLIEKQIKVREKFLKAVEDNNWQFFSSKIYITGIIKNYASFLRLDYKKILAFFRREYESIDDMKFKKKVASAYLVSDTKRIMIALIILISLFFFVYFGYQMVLYLSPPNLVIVEPKSTLFKHIDKIKIVGKTEKDASITIFGDRIYQNKEGFFEYDFPLQIGQNNLRIEIMGANGKKIVATKTFVKQE